MIPAAEIPLLGAFDGSDYYNTELGFGCTLPGWEYASLDAFARYLRVTEKNLEKTVYKLYENGETTPVMEASSPDGQKNVRVKILDIGAFRGVLADEDEEIILRVCEKLAKDNAEMAGGRNIKIRTDETEFCGEETQCVRISYTYEGIRIYQALLGFVKDGNLVSVTVTSVNESDADAVFSSFNLYD